MLRSIELRGKEVPVPVPVTDLEELVHWIENTLVDQTEVITGIFLSGRDMLDVSRETWIKFPLTDKSKVKISLDSPKELAIQSIEVMMDFASEIQKRLQKLAIECWQDPNHAQIKDLRDIASDVKLVIQLTEHMCGMVDHSHADVAPVRAISVLVEKVDKRLLEAVKTEDWKKCARVLIGQLEPLLRDLSLEGERLEFKLYSLEKTHHMYKTSAM